MLEVLGIGLVVVLALAWRITRAGRDRASRDEVIVGGDNFSYGVSDSACATIIAASTGSDDGDGKGGCDSSDDAGDDRGDAGSCDAGGDGGSGSGD